MAEMKEGGRLIKSDGSIVPRISLSLPLPYSSKLAVAARTSGERVATAA